MITTSTESFTYVLIPLIAIFAIGSIAVFFQMRKRRRLDPNYGQWPGGSVPAGAIVLRIRRNLTRSDEESLNEGLNELGQAPPPYEGKKTAHQHQQQREEDQAGGNELRDMEEGRRPPEYIAEPQPAIIAERRTLRTEGSE